MPMAVITKKMGFVSKAIVRALKSIIMFLRPARMCAKATFDMAIVHCKSATVLAFITDMADSILSFVFKSKKSRVLSQPVLA